MVKRSELSTVNKTSIDLSKEQVFAVIDNLRLLESIAIKSGNLTKRISPNELDALGLEGKDCPCAPR